MTSEYFKIICQEQGTDIAKVVRTVYGSLRYLLETVKPEQDIQSVLEEKQAHLLVVDNTVCKYTAMDLRKLRMTNPQIFLLLVDTDAELPEQVAELDDVRILNPNELISKLPPILGDVYSEFNNSILTGLKYGRLIKESLHKVAGLVFITNKDGDLIFMNQVAENIFELKENQYHDMNIQDLLVDGRKSWFYILENCCVSDSEINKFLLKFSTAQNEVHTTNVNIQKVEIDKPYFLLQEMVKEKPSNDQFVESDIDILEKFAESIANELLNPANVISGRLQMMHGTLEDKSKSEKNLDTIARQVERVDEIISKLLTFARLKQDFVPQKIQLNEVLQRLQLEPSITRLFSREDIKVDFRYNTPTPLILGQISQIDLLFKLFLEICFDCVGSAGQITVDTFQQGNAPGFGILLKYPNDLHGSAFTLNSYLGDDGDETKQKSIETTIIKEIIRQYYGTYSLIRIDRDTEKFELVFQNPNQSIEEAQ